MTPKFADESLVGPRDLGCIPETRRSGCGGETGEDDKSRRAYS
jgi:hypothetical protein